MASPKKESDPLVVKEKKGSDDVVKDKALSDMTSQQKFVLGLLTIFSLSMVGLLSVQFTLLGPMAVDKGLTDGYIGWIVTASDVALNITALIGGVLITKIGSWNLLVIGISIGGAASFSFGFVSTVESATLFFWLSMLLSTLVLTGLSAFTIAIMTLKQEEFPHHFQTVMSIVIAGQSVSFALFPLPAGSLFLVGGYILSFIVVSIPALLSLMAAILFLWWRRNHKNMPPDHQDSEEDSVSRKDIKELVFSPFVITIGLEIFLFAITSNYTGVFIPVHVKREFDWTPFDISLLLAGGAAFYSFSCLFAGAVSNKLGQDRVMFCGTCLGFLSMIFLGPAQFLNISPSPWQVVFAYLVNRVAQACALIPSAPRIREYACESLNLPANSKKLQGALSTIYLAYFNLGVLAGAILGGQLGDVFGFEVTSFTFGVAILAMGIVHLVFILLTKFQKFPGSGCLAACCDILPARGNDVVMEMNKQ